MLLVSLLLQIILIIFGSPRKYIARSWVRIFVWCAYLSADLVATVALVFYLGAKAIQQVAVQIKQTI
jgi:hypothetical protein